VGRTSCNSSQIYADSTGTASDSRSLAWAVQGPSTRVTRLNVATARWGHNWTGGLTTLELWRRVETYT